MKAFSLIVLASLLLMGCHWFKKKDDPTPLEQLPPATQEGKRIFGCLLNGQVWTPSGNNGTSNYNVAYDPTYYGGTLDIRAYRIEKQNNSSDFRQYLRIAIDSLSHIGTYSLNKPYVPGGGVAQYLISQSGTHIICDYTYENDIYRVGSLTITRLDLSAGIISGTFEFTLGKPGCDTIKVTNGRFDRKL